MQKRGRYIVLAGSLLVLILLAPLVVHAQEKNKGIVVPGGVYIKLTEDFYKALRAEGAGEAKIYSNDPSTEYLKEISISSRFTVETNLQILRNQERIIQLLQSILKNKRK